MAWIIPAPRTLDVSASLGREREAATRRTPVVLVQGRTTFMSRAGASHYVVAAIAVAAVGVVAVLLAERRPRPITVDYPLEGSVFPPEFAPPDVPVARRQPTRQGVDRRRELRRRRRPVPARDVAGRAAGNRGDRPAGRGDDERAAPADARAGHGAHLETGPRDLGGDQEGLDREGRGPHDHRLRRRGAGGAPCRAGRSRSGPRPTPSARPSSTGTFR